MNCANHADQSAVAYCRTCGKALCANCTRPVKGVIYCEDCLGARMEGKVPPGTAAFVPGAAPGAPGAPGLQPTGPNPALAGILGAIPFGVGAVYNGQYAKGLAHLTIFSLLILGANASGRGSDALNVICGIGMAFFWVYQIIDAVRSARALQLGQPAPDPFGLAQTFSGGRNLEASKVPAGAVILIVIGVFFLLHTAGLFDVDLSHFWPFLLILLGGWMFATRWGLVGTPAGCTCERCRAQDIMWPAILTTIGIVALIGSFRHIGLLGYVGAVLLVIGGVKLFRDGASSEGHRDSPAPGAGPTSGGSTPAPPTPPNEVSHG